MKFKLKQLIEPCQPSHACHSVVSPVKRSGFVVIVTYQATIIAGRVEGGPNFFMNANKLTLTVIVPPLFVNRQIDKAPDKLILDL